ncbi:hypothetical protein B0H10DRAFT_676738 [Mycena sp. CBHHK59/15]|nr:hypothetical protein B0H10DRAFT_676738 [Mycena sp. CBHHK59/15]
MRLAQELVDEIIDEVHISAEAAPSLKSCALVSHAFLARSQMCLFSVIHLKDDLSRLRFSFLLSSSPHLCAYVMELFMFLNTSLSTNSAECLSKSPWEDVAHILSKVTNLTWLKITSWDDSYHGYFDEPGRISRFQAPFLLIPRARPF